MTIVNTANLTNAIYIMVDANPDAIVRAWNDFAGLNGYEKIKPFSKTIATKLYSSQKEIDEAVQAGEINLAHVYYVVDAERVKDPYDKEHLKNLPANAGLNDFYYKNNDVKVRSFRSITDYLNDYDVALLSEWLLERQNWHNYHIEPIDMVLSGRSLLP